jgi:hypothetical protein
MRRPKTKYNSSFLFDRQLEDAARVGLKDLLFIFVRQPRYFLDTNRDVIKAPR